MRLRTTRERFRSGSMRRPRGYEESRQGVVKHQYFSNPGSENIFVDLLCFGHVWTDLQSNFRYSNLDGRNLTNFRCAQSLVSGLSRSSRMRLLAEGQWNVDRTADCR